MKPIIVDKNKINKYLSDRRFRVYDFYEKLEKELYAVKNPRVYFDKKDKDKFLDEYYKGLIGNKDKMSLGTWIVFEWKKEVYHVLNRDKYIDLRTIRNRNLITKGEQANLYKKKICLAGLSVGSNVLMGLIRMGIGNKYNIADFDTVDVHNMNRANYFLKDIGRNKIDLILDQIYSVDPYLDVRLWNKGLNEDNICEFVNDCDLIVDCFDNFPVKILLREIAKDKKIPVISGFDIENGSMVILERYDIEDSLDIGFYLNGFSKEEIFDSKKTPEEKTKMFVNIIGKENHSKKMMDSVMSMGSELTGYPQLNIATLMTAATWLKVITDLFLGKNNNSIRKYIDLNKLV